MTKRLTATEVKMINKEKKHYFSSPEFQERMDVFMKILDGAKLTKAEKKLAGIMSAELTEQLIWQGGV